MWVQSLGQEDPLEKHMATHSSILAWEMPWTQEPGRLETTQYSITKSLATPALPPLNAKSTAGSCDSLTHCQNPRG